MKSVSTESQTIPQKSQRFSLNSEYSQELPQTELHFIFRKDQLTLLEAFQHAIDELQYQRIQMEDNHVTAVKIQSPTLKDYLNCLHLWQSSTKPTAIKLEFWYHGNQLQCHLKGLSGSTKRISQFFSVFRKNMELEKNYEQFNNICNKQQFNQQHSNPFHMEVCTIYLVHRLLSSDDTVGLKTQKLIKQFREHYQSIAESSVCLPLPLKNALSIIEEIVQEISKLLCFQANYREYRKYYKIGVEKYVFQKLHIYDIYNFKHENTGEHNKFKRQVDLIFNTYTLQQLFQEVSLRPCFWAVEAQHLSNRYSVEQACSVIAIGHLLGEMKKIRHTSNIREKIKYCEITYSSIKYYYQKNRADLSSMEDIIPAMIILVLLLRVDNLRTQLDLMVDFVHLQGSNMETEKRLIINISESYNYISRDWKVIPIRMPQN